MSSVDRPASRLSNSDVSHVLVMESSLDAYKEWEPKLQSCDNLDNAVSSFPNDPDYIFGK